MCQRVIKVVELYVGITYKTVHTLAYHTQTFLNYFFKRLAY